MNRDKRLKGKNSVVGMLSIFKGRSQVKVCQLCMPSNLKLNRHQKIAVIPSNYNFMAIT